MLNVFVVAPHQRFADAFREVFAKQQKETRDSAVKLDVAVEYYEEKLREMRPSCDVIIARGSAAAVLRRGPIPVVEVSILPHDLVRVWQAARAAHPGKRVVCLATADFVSPLESLTRLVGLDIEYVYLPSTLGRDPEKALDTIADPANCVIIGGKPVTNPAEQRGIPCYNIESGPEAMRSALLEALRLAEVRLLEQERAQRFKSILDYNSDGIIAQDAKNRFTTLNAMAEKILEVSAVSATGKTLADFHPDDPLTVFLDKTPHCSDEVVLFKTVPLVVNKRGIFFKGERIGSVVTLQYLSRVQNTEKNIRNQITDRGLVAKHTFEDIKGDSRPIRLAVETALKFAAVDSGVLIVGQSGTGKELFAQSIHTESPQCRFPFMAINCAAIPESLLESELFGYAEGAFTGAAKGGKPGLIELAHMGTLFLDEIGEMPLRVQARLLRVLQEKEIMRIGSEKITPVSIRVIAATNKNLPDLVRDGLFREDLYYRLAVLTLRVSSLEQRREDIPQLVNIFVEATAKRLRRPVPEIAVETLGLLSRLSWLGNVRELRNICEQLVVLCESGTIELAEAETVLAEKIWRSEQRRGAGAVENEQPRQTECTPELVETLLSQGYSKQKVADFLGINRSTLWRRMQEWDGA